MERCLARMASDNSRPHHRRRHRRQARSTRRGEPIVGVRRGRGETGGTPGKLGTLGRSRSGRGRSDKAAWSCVDGRLLREAH
jgi:hypothetical protein